MRTLLSVSLLAFAMLAVVAPASAQRYEIDLSRLDPSAVLSSGGDVLRRASAPAVDELFQAVLLASRDPKEARALCALFEPDASRDIAAFQRAVDTLGAASQNRFANAFTNIALSGLQGTTQVYEPSVAQQILRSAGVRASLLHDGFMLGMTSTGVDDASRQARCRSFRQLVDVLKDQPQAERVTATRWLLNEGLTLVADAQASR